MAMKKIKRDDEVVVIAGKDKGKRGKVLKVLDDNRLLVSGVQMMKKHQSRTLKRVFQAELLKRKRQFKFQMSRSLTVQQTKSNQIFTTTQFLKIDKNCLSFHFITSSCQLYLFDLIV